MSSEIVKTSIRGVFEIRYEPFKDNRGSFKNIFRASDPNFLNIWKEEPIKQVNISETKLVGTIRGLHMQKHPHTESKLISCLEGEVWDVAVDLRRDSVTYGQWISCKLSDKVNNAIYIPKGCAHGFQVLKPNTKLLYLHSGNWNKDSEIGLRWNDIKLNIKWPLKVTEVSARDQNLPFLK